MSEKKDWENRKQPIKKTPNRVVFYWLPLFNELRTRYHDEVMVFYPLIDGKKEVGDMLSDLNKKKNKPFYRIVLFF